MDLEPQLPSANGNENAERLASEACEREIVAPTTFYKTTEPVWNLPKEQAWHRLAAFAFALGATCKDVAKQLDRSELAVQNLLRQPWFQKNVTALMAEYGSKDIMELLRAEQINSLCTIIEIRDDPKASKNTRALCAKDILDRTLGKPTQRVEVSSEAASLDPVAEVERLEAEVNRLKQ